MTVSISINKKGIEMFEYTKTILQKVSFNKDLFSKELKKSFRWLKKDEIVALQIWCLMTFGHVYGDVISETFSNVKF